MIDACITSVGEPQLERCLKAVREQVIPFATIIHVDGIVPEVESFKRALGQTKSEWMMKIDGDMILYPEATKVARSCIDNEKDRSVVEYQFGLRDVFLDRTINSCRVSKVDVIKSVRQKDRMENDYSTVRQMEERGMKCVRLWQGHNPVVVGTHFENPDEFQIFVRFYHAGILRTKVTMRLLRRLYDSTKDKRYDLAIRAMEYGISKGYKKYPGSRDVNYDRKEFEKFNESGSVS